METAANLPHQGQPMVTLLFAFLQSHYQATVHFPSVSVSLFIFLRQYHATVQFSAESVLCYCSLSFWVSVTELFTFLVNCVMLLFTTSFWVSIVLLFFFLLQQCHSVVHFLSNCHRSLFLNNNDDGNWYSALSNSKCFTITLKCGTHKKRKKKKQCSAVHFPSATVLQCCSYSFWVIVTVHFFFWVTVLLFTFLLQQCCTIVHFFF